MAQDDKKEDGRESWVDSLSNPNLFSQEEDKPVEETDK
jgi:hypothetical protein